MAKQGWIKLERSLTEWKYFKRTSVLSLFIYLRLSVAFKGYIHPSNIEVQAGQLLTTTGTLSKKTGLSISKIRTALKLLEEDQKIEIKTFPDRFTLISLKNFSTVVSTDDSTVNDTDNSTVNDTDEEDINNCKSEDDKEEKGESDTVNDTDDSTVNDTDDNTGVSTYNKNVSKENDLKEDLTGPSASNEAESEKDLKSPPNTPPEGEEKRKVAPKEKRQKLLISKAKKLPRTDENRYYNAAIHFWSLLKPFHEDKYTFQQADVYKWAADLKTIEKTHKRKLEEVFDLIKWVIKNDNSSLAYIQSTNYLVKRSGKNLDTLKGKMQFSDKKKEDKSQPTINPGAYRKFSFDENKKSKDEEDK